METQNHLNGIFVGFLSHVALPGLWSFVCISWFLILGFYRLWVFYMYFFPFSLPALFSKEKERRYGVRRVGRLWEEMGEEKHDQNIFYVKHVFTEKKERKS